MGLFSKRGRLDYSAGNGLLPKVGNDKFLPHTRPGSMDLILLDFDLLKIETSTGRDQILIEKVVTAARNSDPAGVSFEYEDVHEFTNQAEGARKIPEGDNLDESISFFIGLAEKQNNNARNIYQELLPYLKEFETKIEIELTKQERSAILALFRVGHALAWRENLSQNGINGYMHPSIRNALYSLVADPFVREKAELLDDLITNSISLRSEQVFIYIGYFLSQYNLESPQFVMEKFPAWTRKSLANNIS